MENISKVPLTLEATEDDTEITIKNTINKTIQYKVNGKDKISITNTENITGLKAGDIVQFFSTNASLYIRVDAYEDYLNIKPSKKTYVYGNVMSLIDDGRTDANTPNFANDKTIGADNALSLLFWNADKLVFHDTKKLLLPATTLTISCYDGMFSFCTGLTTLPEDLLPATTLADGCYARMFNGCTGLTTLPEDLLPTKTLTKSCYESMFNSCTGLTTAPILPATTLKDYCYWSMFFNCTKLNSVTCLATDITAQDCLFNWLDGAGTAEGITSRTLYVNPSMTGADWQLGTSGWAPSNYVAKSCALSEVTSNEIGWRIGSDGVAYEPAGALPGVGTPQAVTPVAMITYVSSTGHGYAIELSNNPSHQGSWNAAYDHPASMPAIPNCTWIFADEDTWKNKIYKGCDGDAKKFLANYSATGFTAELDGICYWTNNPDGSYADSWYYDSQNGYFYNSKAYKTHTNFYYLACLTF